MTRPPWTSTSPSVSADWTDSTRRSAADVGRRGDRGRWRGLTCCRTHAAPPVGEWGSIAAAAGAAGTTVSTLAENLADAAAAGVTRLYGQRRLWHTPATATWWAGVTAAADTRTAAVAEVRRDRAADIRQRHAAGVPVAAMAAEPGVGVTTVRRDLRPRGLPLRARRMSGPAGSAPGRCSPVRSAGEVGGAS